jgi:hypothetical protein
MINDALREYMNHEVEPLEDPPPCPRRPRIDTSEELVED